MKRRRYNLPSLKIVLLLVLVAGFFGITFFLPPSNYFVISALITLLSAIAFITSSFYLTKKYQYLIAVSVALFFTVNLLVGFQLLNTILLFSLIIGVAILLR